MKKWILVVVACAVIGGCIGCDKTTVQGNIDSSASTLGDGNSTFNKAIDNTKKVVDAGSDTVNSPLGLLLPEAVRTPLGIVLGIAGWALGAWQTNRRKVAEQGQQLATNTLSSVVNAIENYSTAPVNANAVNDIKQQVKANLIDNEIYPDGKQLIMSVKE
jgi:hypothetical protein